MLPTNWNIWNIFSKVYKIYQQCKLYKKESYCCFHQDFLFFLLKMWSWLQLKNRRCGTNIMMVIISINTCTNVTEHHDFYLKWELSIIILQYTYKNYWNNLKFFSLIKNDPKWTFQCRFRSLKRVAKQNH